MTDALELLYLNKAINMIDVAYGYIDEATSAGQQAQPEIKQALLDVREMICEEVREIKEMR